MLNNLLKALTFLLILTSYGLILYHPVNLPTDDLGRHLTNGKIIWETKEVAETNLYSFTCPDFPFINHHWLSGVIFYFIWLWSGFQGLTIFKIIVYLATFLIFFRLAAKRGGFYPAAILSFPVILILNERTDLRPEMFSYFFAGLYWLILENHYRRRTELRISRFRLPLVYILVPLQILWSNLHIYSFLGFVVTGVFLADEFFRSYLRNRKKTLPENLRESLTEAKTIQTAKIFGLTVVASLLNPFTYHVTLYPLNILKNYGYDLAENQTPFFMDSLIISRPIAFFKILSVVLIISFVWRWTQRKFSLKYFLLAVFAIYSGCSMVRNLALFGFIALPLLTYNFRKLPDISHYLPRKFASYEKYYSPAAGGAIAVAAAIFCCWIASGNYQLTQSITKSTGLGLVENNNDSMNFFRENNLHGPIFNSYDNGGYLIWHLYPEEKVFVDNRPEAYPAEFFSETYRPMQWENGKWEEMLTKYNFNVIYIPLSEGTPWGQNFVEQRIKDEKWALVFADWHFLIFLRHSEENRTLIGKYALTPENIESRTQHLFSGNLHQKKLSALSQLYQLFQRNDLAENTCQKIADRYPQSPRGFLCLGNLHSGSNEKADLEKANEELKKVLELGHKLPAITNQIGLNYFRLDNYLKAKEYWQKTLKLDGNNETAKSYLEQINILNLP